MPSWYSPSSPSPPGLNVAEVVEDGERIPVLEHAGPIVGNAGGGQHVVRVASGPARVDPSGSDACQVAAPSARHPHATGPSRPAVQVSRPAVEKSLGNGRWIVACIVVHELPVDLQVIAGHAGGVEPLLEHPPASRGG